MGPPPDVRIVARWTLESSASISDPSLSLLSNKVSQPSQPSIIMVEKVMLMMGVFRRGENEDDGEDEDYNAAS